MLEHYYQSALGENLKKNTVMCEPRLTQSLNACHHRSGVLAAFVLKYVVALHNRVEEEGKMNRCI